VLFAPVGIGRHVDHLITRTVGTAVADRIVYYADFPDNRSERPDPRFLAAHRLVPWTWNRGLAGKVDLIRGYRTQADARFPDGDIPQVPETYYLATS